jgi:hypothetical protein
MPSRKWRHNMGYTHYWKRKERFNAAKFEAVVRDFKTIMPELDKLGVKLADGHGKSQPIITDNEIVFNGPTNCGHPEQDLGITWPSNSARGIANTSENVQDGTWFAGATLQARACGGDCSHEGFVLEKYESMPDYQKTRGNKLTFDFCKTAYKPYDIAVTAALIIAKHHLGNAIKISSDGNAKDWFDAALLIKTTLGYGFDFQLETEE